MLTNLLLSLALAAAAQSGDTALDNPYVQVTRNGAPCAAAKGALCATDRIIVALTPLDLNSVKGTRKLGRGDIAVFGETEVYVPPVGGQYFEVVLKADRPPVKSPSEIIPPEKNSILHDGARFFVFHEQLDPGDTRARHGHSQRVVVQLNATTLQQWPEGEPEVIREMRVDQAAFNEPVIHVVKNVGKLPLHGIVIEFKPERR